jgi:large subunit ribosomal protein L10
MLSKTKKGELVQQLTEIVQKHSSVIFSDFSGLSTPELDELRRSLRERGVYYKVTKKSLWPYVRERANIPEEALSFGEHKGSVAMAYTPDEGVNMSKALTKFAKEHEKLVILGGFMNGETFTVDRIRQLAALPSREELLAKLVYLCASPMQRFARVVAAPHQQLVTVLGHVQKQK